MVFKPKLFLKEALLFGSTLALGLFVAYRYIGLLAGAVPIQTSSFTLGDFFSLVFVIILFLLVSRSPRLMGWVFWVFLCLLILSGTQIIIAAFAPAPWDSLGALVALIVFLTVRNVLVHDVAIIAAIAGVGATVGIIISPAIGVWALVLLSFYDIIAVYQTKHMVRMAEGMIRSGAVFGFVIPPSFGDFFSRRKEANQRVGTDFMILGSGDIGLPLIFVASLVRQSLAQAVIVALFAMGGLLATHILFVSQKKRAPMAALPPIATVTLLGYLLVVLLR